MSGERVMRIVQICARYQGSDYFVEELIPPKKLQNAREAYPIPQTERVIALVDATVFGSAKNGLAIGERGIYWKNDWATSSANHFLSWEQLGGVEIRCVDSFNLELGSGNVFNMAGSSFEKDDLMQLLKQLQTATAPGAGAHSRRVDSAAPPQPPKPAGTWLVAMDGEQYGPFDLPTIKRMLIDGKIVAEESFVWAQGMTDWKPFLQEPVFQKLVAGIVAQVEAEQKPGNVPPPPPKAKKASEEEPIDLNIGSLDELLTLPGIGLEEAQKLIAHREKAGGFAGLDQVEELLKLKPHQVQQWKGRVTFTPAAPKESGFGRVIDF